jgi:hypothetical protein
MTSTDRPDAQATPPAPQADQARNPHNFEVQKEIHQRIRNDPDYDDWEYGTEPLPHEAWVARQQAARGGGAAS